MVRATIEKTYTDICSIYGVKEIKLPNGSTQIIPNAVLVSEEPCRLSFTSGQTTVVSDDSAVAPQVVKLFIRPELEVPTGSRIKITRNGRSVEYRSSGQSAFYDTHQEIVLDFKERS